MSSAGRRLYASSNGDAWYLCRSAAGRPVVRHEPNAASGGRPSDVELGAFLAERNQGPQHQALLEAISQLAEPRRVQAEFDDHD